MVSIEDVPAEVRWKIAAKSGMAMTIAYDMAFRRAFGDQVNNLEIPIWAEGGKEAANIATSLKLPARNALEIDDTLDMISKIMMGPGFEGKRIEATDDHVVYKMTGCPVFNAHKEMGADMIITQDVCQAFCSNAVESLNPRYTIRYTKHMCAGDSNCEYIIGLKR